MAWTSPRTWVSGEVITAALLNTHVRDNQLELNGTAGAWTAYTPTIQGFTGTLVHARYKQHGKTTHVQVRYTITGVTGNLQVGLPIVPQVSSQTGLGSVLGIDSGVSYYDGVVFFDTGSFVSFANNGSIWSAAIPFTWGASGDAFGFQATYEAA